MNFPCPLAFGWVSASRAAQVDPSLLALVVEETDVNPSDV